MSTSTPQTDETSTSRAELFGEVQEGGKHCPADVQFSHRRARPYHGERSLAAYRPDWIAVEGLLYLPGLHLRQPPRRRLAAEGATAEKPEVEVFTFDAYAGKALADKG